MKFVPKLSTEEKQCYIQEVVIANFMPLVEQPILSYLCDDSFKIIVCTNLTASTLGYGHWQDAVGVGYQNFLERAEQIPGIELLRENQEEIEKYIEVIIKLQKKVFITGQIASFFDLLPYNGVFKSYLVTYIPVFHPNGEVVALQSFAHESKFFGFQEHFFQLVSAPLDKNYPQLLLTKREQEVMFLLANGLSQPDIAKTLQISRSTVAGIISNQLSEKFSIPGSNTNLLTKIAIECGYFQRIPESLYRPFVVSLLPD